MRRLVSLLLVLTFIFAWATPAFASDALSVYYFGAPNSSVLTALELAEFNLVEDPDQADVILLNGAVSEVDKIVSQVEAGAGLVLIMGSQVEYADAQTVLGIPIELESRTDPVSLTEVKIDDPLTTEIIWNSAPQIRERVETITPISSVEPFVTTYEDGSWILWQARPNILVLNAFIESEETNPQIQQWAYYNYLIYHLVTRVGGQSPLSFADYPGYLC